MIFEIFIIVTGIGIAYKMSSPPKHRNQQIPYTKPRATTYEQAKENLRKLERKNELEAQREKERNEYIEIDLRELFKPEKKSNEYYKQKREFKTFTAEEKKEYAIKQRELREEKQKKGTDYEAYIAEHYRSLGYEVIERGKKLGLKDGGIDLIAKNHKEAIMIQCKNWNAENKYKIDQKDIGDFIGKVSLFLAKNPEYKNYNIKRILTVAEPILDKSALAIINENREMVRYEHIPLL
jgi:Holliday junction resolvase-like predicted endonuclease